MLWVVIKSGNNWPVFLIGVQRVLEFFSLVLPLSWSKQQQTL